VKEDKTKELLKTLREINWGAVGYAMGKVMRDVNIDQDEKDRAIEVSEKLRKVTLLLPDCHNSTQKADE
jgi:hypothetical protein